MQISVNAIGEGFKQSFLMTYEVQKGASAASILAFQFASTNLVWELGLVLWVLIGWQFTLGEYIGGIVMIILMATVLRLFVSPRLEESARRHAQQADTGHQHHSAGSKESASWRQRFTSSESWSDVAHNFRGDWQMLWKEITVGFLLAVLPIVAASRKYYGWPFAWRITALMFVTMVVAALIVDGLFSALGLIPSGARPTRDDIFGSVELDYKLVLNVLDLLVFTALFWLTMHRGGDSGS